MTSAAISALALELSDKDRAALAVELIDSLGGEVWDDDDIVRELDARDAELESGEVKPLSYDEFLAGIKRPSAAS